MTLAGRVEFIGRVSSNTIRRDSLDAAKCFYKSGLCVGDVTPRSRLL